MKLASEALGMSIENWKKCTTCKKPIAFGALYWVCNVTTCNRKRTGLTFCTVDCWDAHVPVLRHKNSWSEERRAPSREEWARIQSGEGLPARVKASPSPLPEQEAPQSAASVTTGPSVIRRRPS